MDFETTSSQIGVKPSVLRLLFDKNPFAETNEWILKSKNTEEFWERVDTLPPQISLALHKEELFINEGKDFPKGSIEPDFFDFFQANCISNGEDGVLANQTAIYLTNNEIMEHALESEGWNKEEDGTFSISENSFSVESLCMMCDAFINGSCSWKVCPYDPIRNEYSRIEDFLQNVDKRLFPALNGVFSKMQNFEYATSAEFKEDASVVLDEKTLSEFEDFELDGEINEKLSQLMKVTAEEVVANPHCAEHNDIDDDTMNRVENLVTQMKIPFPQRTAFALTPPMISARAGTCEDTEDAFESGSLAQLLFCDSIGNPMPLPYQSRSVEMPASSMHKCCSAAIRKYVALVLKENQFKAAPASVLDVLTDYTEEMIKTIAQFTKIKGKAFKTESEALENTMLEIGVLTKPSLQ